MKSIAVLMTCFNRCDKTLKCLEKVYQSDIADKINIDVFIVDGGSTDNTPELIAKSYPQINIEVVKGLYWAGGMRRAWQNACRSKNYDFFLLLNDDTYIFKDCINNLLEADDYSMATYHKHGIYSACTKSGVNGKLTYGGRVLKNVGHLKSELKEPSSSKYIECDLCNGNILLVPFQIFEVIGSLHERYTHSIADWDYSLRVKQKGYPVLIIPNYQGECERDHGNETLTHSIPLKQRIRMLKSVKGSYYEFLEFTKEFFPKDYYYMKALFWFKTLFPETYKFLKRI